MSWLITPELKSIEGVRWDDIPSSRKWTPANTTTALWLDAADATTITESGGAVSQWNDKSGNGLNVSQSDSAARPTLTAQSLNGKSVLSFDGTGDFLERASVSLHTGTWSAFALARQTAASGVRSILDQDLVPDRLGQYLRVSGENFESIAFNTINTAFTASRAWSPLSWTISGAIRSTDQISARLNGGTAGNTSTTGTPASGSTRLRVGDRQGVFWNGFIAEIVFIAGAATDTTRQQVEGYLAHKWDLAANLPSDHPYKTTPPTP
jgi:hypothetical protein